MSECTRLSERIPEIASGQARWTPSEAAHLGGCADCRAELALVQATVALGRKAPKLADPAAMAASVERRVAEARTRRGHARRTAGLAAAAGLLLVVWVRWPNRPADLGTAPPPGPAAEALVPLPELQLLEPAELDSLLERMELPVTGSSTLDAPALGDLEDTELEQVLATWEG